MYMSMAKPVISNQQSARIADFRTCIKATKDNAFLYDNKGIIISVSLSAANFFNQSQNELTGKILWELLPEEFAYKTLFAKIRRYTKLAEKGMPQQFEWQYKKNKRPLKALSIMLNSIILNNDHYFIVNFFDILPAKIIEWSLSSLAEIHNQRSINDVINIITKLAGNVFNAEYSMVNLIDTANFSHSVSFYHEGKKLKNLTINQENTPGEEIKNNNLIMHFNGNFQSRFGIFFYQDDISSYLGGPITNIEGDVVGLLQLFSKGSLDVNPLAYKLFQLFLDRVSLEIESLIAKRKQAFLVSLPHENPNPIIRVSPEYKVIYANIAGDAILKKWSVPNKELPKKLINACNLARNNSNVIRQEIHLLDEVYIFALRWIADFDQINIYGTDITELKATQQKMGDMANYDTLTKIPNRQYFESTLGDWLEKAKQHKTMLALFLIDLDNFKSVNDNLGHNVGDKLLQTLTKRMTGCLRRSDFMARIGGDEFVVLVKCTPLTNIEAIALKINAALATPFELCECHLETSCSIGITFYPEGGITPIELLKNADIAMYEAKKSGKNQYFIYANLPRNNTNNRDTVIKRDLKNAIKKNQFYIDYQPQFDLELGKIIGLEAFIRWRHPKQGLISPSEFIPLAENTGAIYTIGNWIVNQTLCDYINIISDVTDAKLSINVALSQLNDQKFINNFCERLQENNIEENNVIIDIAEQHNKLNYHNLDANLKTLHNSGVQLSLDNFGGIHTSLSRLLEIPVDFLKIDHNLLHSMDDKYNKNAALISGIIDLGDKLQMNVVQKGVENEEQNVLLKNLGCKYAQGFYYCRPLSLDKLILFITRHNQKFHR